MENYKYISSKVVFGELGSNGDMFIGVRPEEFIGKPVSINFEHDKPPVGVVIDAKETTEQEKSIVLTISVEKNFKTDKFLDATMGFDGFKDEHENLSIGSVSFLPKPYN